MIAPTCFGSIRSKGNLVRVVACCCTLDEPRIAGDECNAQRKREREREEERSARKIRVNEGEE